MPKTIDLSIPRTAEERIAAEEGLRPEYLALMRVHVDEGGQLSHRNGLDLLAEVERLNRLLQRQNMSNRAEV